MFRLDRLKNTILGKLSSEDKDSAIKETIASAKEKLDAIDPESSAFIFMAIASYTTSPEQEADGASEVTMDTLVAGNLPKEKIARCLQAQVEVLGGRTIQMAEYWDRRKPDDA